LSQAIVERKEEAHEILSNAIKEIADIPGNCETETLEGDPAETILRVVDTYPIDAIVMGTRGHGKISSLILGSQSHKGLSAAP
jgi:nucleotide-binding universal stress UspA family protein